MAVKQEIKYLRSKGGEIVEVRETRLLTRDMAIKLHCLDCAGGISKAVRECEINLCPLYLFRPYQKKKGDA